MNEQNRRVLEKLKNSNSRVLGKFLKSKRVKLIKTFFSENLKNEHSRVLESSPQLLSRSF